MMPPFWAMGHFIGSNAFQTADELTGAVTGHMNDGIPIEGVIVDSYMRNSQAFTVDPDRFKNI